jgi:ABC-2 type transport system ATP-binding protein
VAAPLIDVRGLTKQFGVAACAVQDLSLTTRAGEVYCLLGGTGAGKTTTIKMLLGLLPPSAGQATVAGVDVTADPLGARAQTTFLTGRGTLSGAMTTLQNLRFLVRIARPGPWRETDGRNALRTMGVPDRAFDERVKNLPRDLVMALWLAVAWLRATPVLLLDEPTTGLDAKAATRLQTRLARFRDRGQAVFIATADILFAGQIADRIGILKQGRMAAERTRAEVLSLSLTELYVDYVGRPPHRVSLEHPAAPRRLGA